jgi:hypothetical protein
VDVLAEKLADIEAPTVAYPNVDSIPEAMVKEL